MSKYQSIFNSGTIDSSSNVNSQNVYCWNNRVDNSVDNRVITTTINMPQQGDSVVTGRECSVAWLSNIPYDARHKDIVERREKQTGTWLLESPKFVEWLDEKSAKRILLAYGMPGASKTFLASVVIDHLQSRKDKKIAITYVYCNDKAQIMQTAVQLTRSLLHQLAMETDSSTIHDNIFALYKKYKEAIGTPSITDYLEILKSAIRAFQEVIIIIDALDEVVTTEWDRFTNVIKSLAALGARVFITSRELVNILEALKMPESVQLEIPASNKDIEVYLRRQMIERIELARISRQDPLLIEETVKGIRERAQGMFLLAQFHLDQVAQAVSPNDVRSALKQLPSGLDKVYESIIENIRKGADSDWNPVKILLT